MAGPFEIGHVGRQTRTKRSRRGDLRRNRLREVLPARLTVTRATAMLGDQRRFLHEFHLHQHLGRRRKLLDRPTTLRTRLVSVSFQEIDVAWAKRWPLVARMPLLRSPPATA